MNSNFDSDNLMYLSKQYENEIRSKADKIYANDEVAISIENVNKELDDILLEMNEKIGFIVNKVIGTNGIDDYVNGVHQQIDNVEVNYNNLVDAGIKNTESHPSSLAFKEDKSNINYDTYDFINKCINFNSNSDTGLQNIKIDGQGQLDDADIVHEFKFNANYREYLKIIEFSFTYKQNPVIKSSIEDEGIDTVEVTRVINGRFFIIRHNPRSYPNDFIIKAIVENADNTGNVIDRKIVDVKEYKENGNISCIFDNGPQFELYFKSTDTKFSIYIGKIVPYRYVIEKTTYGEPADTEKAFALNENFNGMDNTSSDIADIFHSDICNAFVGIDYTNRKIGYSTSLNISDMRSEYISGSTRRKLFGHNGSNIEKFWIKDVGNYCFIRIKDQNQDTTYIAQNSLTNVINLYRRIDDAVYLSSGEIVVLDKSVGKWYYFDTQTNEISTTEFCDLSSIISECNNSNFVFDSKIIELDDMRAVIFVTSDVYEKYIQFRVKEKNSLTGSYKDNNRISHLMSLTKIRDEINSHICIRDPYIMQFDASELDVIKTISGIFIGIKFTGEDNRSLILNVNDLINETSFSYYFNNQTCLQYYERYNNDESNVISYDSSKSYEKIISTSDYTFMISSDHKLFILDEKYIIKALKFKQFDNDLNYVDDGILFLKPYKNGQANVYSLRNSENDDFYCNDVKDVVDTPIGTYIVDGKGVYSLHNNELVCEYYIEHNYEGGLIRDDVIRFIPKANHQYDNGLLLVKKCVEYSDYRYSTFINSYDISNKTNGQKIRYEHIDLFGKNYQLYTNDVNASYDEDLPIIEFKAQLYCTFVDHLSILYNYDRNYGQTTAATYGTKTYSVINNSQKYILTPNKYGFIKYDNILTIDPNSKNRISNINEIKRFKFIHKSTDTETYQDVLNAVQGVVSKLGEELWKKITENGTTYDITIRSFNNYNDLDRTASKTGDFNNITDYITHVKTKYGNYFLTKSGIKLLSPMNQNNVDDPSFYKLVNFYPTTVDPNEIYNFDIEIADDNYETCFLSDGKNVYKTQAYNPSNDPSLNGVFTLPFTDNNSYIGLQDSNGRDFNRIRKYDNEIYLWGSNTSLCKFSPITGEITDVEICNEPEIIDFIKIGNNYHVLCIEHDTETVNNESVTFYKVYYKIYGGKIYSTVLYKTDVPLIAKSFNAHFYNFNTATLFCINLNGLSGDSTKLNGQYIWKYDSNEDEFVESIKWEDIPHSHDKYGTFMLSFGEYKDTIYVANEGKKFGVISDIGIYRSDLNRILPVPNHNIISIRCLQYGENISSDFSPSRKYLPIDEYKKVIYLPFFHLGLLIDEEGEQIDYGSVSGTRQPIVSKPIIKTSKVNFNGSDYNDYYIEEVAYISGKYKLLRRSNSGSSRSEYEIGNKWDYTYGSLLQGILKEYKVQDITESITNNDLIKFYRFDGIHTKMSPLILDDSVTKTIYDKDWLYYVIEVTETNDGYDMIDTDKTPFPICGFEYYILELNGSYRLISNLIEFNPNVNYYIKHKEFKLIKNSEFTFNKSDSSKKYYVAHEIAVTHCTNADFNMNENNTTPSFIDDGRQYLRFEDDLYGVFEIHNINEFPDDDYYLMDDLRCFGDIGDRHKNDHDVAFENETTIYKFGINRPDELSGYHNVISHLTFKHNIIRTFKTKFGYFALIESSNILSDSDTKTKLSLIRCSSDYRYIYDILLSDIDSTIDPDVDINIYETTNDLFLVNKIENKTYKFNLETLKPNIVVYTNSLSFITEFEDGSIYGKDDSSNRLLFIKYNNTEGIIPRFDETQNISNNENISNLKCVKRYNSNGNLELYFYGAGSKYHYIYKLSQNKLVPALTDIPFGYNTYNYGEIQVYDNLLYHVDYNGRNLEICNPDTNEYNIIPIIPNSAPNQVKINIIDTNNIENYIGNVYPEKKFVFVKSNYRILYLRKIRDPFNVPRDSNFETNLTEIIPNNMKFLPLFDKNNNIYFKDCVGNKETLKPDYTKIYKARMLDGSLMDDPKFDRLFMTSIGIFAFTSDHKLFFNDIYNEDNNIFNELSFDISSYNYNVNGFSNPANTMDFIETPVGFYFIIGNSLFCILNTDNIYEAQVHYIHSFALSGNIIYYPSESNWRWLYPKDYLENHDVYPVSPVTMYIYNNRLFLTAQYDWLSVCNMVISFSNPLSISNLLDNSLGNFNRSIVRNICETKLGLFYSGWMYKSNGVDKMANYIYLYTRSNSWKQYTFGTNDEIAGVVVDKIDGDIYAYGNRIWKLDLSSDTWIKVREINDEDFFYNSFKDIVRIEHYSTTKRIIGQEDSNETSMWCVLCKRKNSDTYNWYIAHNQTNGHVKFKLEDLDFETSRDTGDFTIMRKLCGIAQYRDENNKLNTFIIDGIGDELYYESGLFDTKKYGRLTGSNSKKAFGGAIKKVNKYNYNYAFYNEYEISQVIALPFNKTQFFTTYDGQLYSTFYNSKIKQAGTDVISSANRTNRVELIYKFDFIGENKENWNNWTSDKHLSLQDKFVFSRLGKFKYNNSGTSEYSYKNFDMNNIEFRENIDDLPSMYKNIYTSNNPIVKRNIQFKNNKLLKNNLFPSTHELLDDMSIFDNQDFIIELSIYPGYIKDENNSVEINLSRPYDPSKIILNRYNPCLPYNIYEY